MSRASHSIIIDPEFQALIPPLSSDERAILEASIKKEGVRDALSVWDRDEESILLDGHNRFAIASKRDIAFDAIAVPGIETRDDAIVWIIRNQLGRRNLSDFSRVELAERMGAVLKARAKENMVKGGKAGADMTNRGLSNWSNPVAPIDTRAEIAKAAGVGTATVERVRVIKKKGIPELQDAVRSGQVSSNAGACIASLPEDEQRSVVASGPAVVRTRATEIRNGVPRHDSKPEPVPDSAPSSNRPGRPKSDATFDLDTKVKDLAAQGYGTGDIAKELGCNPMSVSHSKRRLGMTRGTNGNPLAVLTEQAVEHAGVWEFALETLNDKSRSATPEQCAALSDELKGLVRAIKRLMSVLAKSEERETESC